MKTYMSMPALLMVLFSFSNSSYGQSKLTLRNNGLTKTNVSQPYVLMNANNLTSWVRSDGFFPAIVKNSWNGEFPKGSGVGTVYQEGIVFGGKVHDGVYADSIRVTGDTYFIGMQAGAIKSDASGNTIGSDDPNDPSVRAFAVRSDMPASIQYDTAAWPDLKSDAASFFQKGVDSVTAQDVHQIAGQYFKDWTEWPAAKGAPWFVDSVKIVRNDAAFDPTNPHDIPGIPDAAKTIWFVCNDENEGLKWQFAGSPPIGMEEQVTLWAFHALPSPLEPLDNVIYKQVKLIYKGNPGASSNAHIDSLFVCQWVDGDIGDGGNDYGGCDSLMNLGFEYNSTATDRVYTAAGLNTPSDGFLYLNGSAVFTGDHADSAIVNFQWRKEYQYNYVRPMTSFFLHQTGTALSDPDATTYSGTLQWYNIMRSCTPRPQYPAGIPLWSAYGFPYMPIPSRVTKYIMGGDPITGTGWIDGLDVSAGDRRFWSTHGPISLGLHDTAEVDIAHVAALGADNIASLQVLKYYSTYAKYVFTASVNPSESVATSVLSGMVARTFEVQQNYPNPFNPSTTIRYQLPTTGRVTIKVFNLLGQEIATLVDEVRQAGVYDVTWNASTVPSGVYFYSTEVMPISRTGQFYRDVKKMVLIK
jgi:hypothetical protein